MLHMCIFLLWLLWFGAFVQGKSLSTYGSPRIRSPKLCQQEEQNEVYALDGRQYHGRQDSNSPPDGRQNVLSTMVKHTDKVHAGILLFALCWRILGLYEISGSGGTIKGFMRYRSVTRISLLLLLMLNILGFALNCLPVPGYRHKNKLKAIVAVNIIREWIEVFYNLYMILLGSDAVDKAIYQGRLFMNIWWSLLCMSFLRTRWVSSLVNGKPDINKDSYEEWVFRSSRGQYQGRR